MLIENITKEEFKLYKQVEEKEKFIGRMKKSLTNYYTLGGLSGVAAIASTKMDVPLGVSFLGTMITGASIGSILTKYGKIRIAKAELNKIKESPKCKETYKKLESIEIEDLVKEDSLACKVTKGKELYVNLIKSIEKKYDSFWSKVFFPKEDEKFDKKVRKVIGSMNNVGKTYNNPEKFTTDGKRNANGLDLLLSLGGGLLSVAPYKLLPFFNTFEYTSKYRIPEEIILPATVAAGITYLGVKCIRFLTSSWSLDELKESTQKTDEFLKNDYIK